MVLLYVATGQQVNAVNTANLLNRPWNAIWCPPPRLRPWNIGNPQPGESLYLLWRADDNDQAIVLGRGNLMGAPRHIFNTDVLWVNPDCPGLREHAEDLDYGGGNAMSFLRLDEVQLLQDPFPAYPAFTSGFNEDIAAYFP